MVVMEVGEPPMIKRSASWGDSLIAYRIATSSPVNGWRREGGIHRDVLQGSFRVNQTPHPILASSVSLPEEALAMKAWTVGEGGSGHWRQCAGHQDMTSGEANWKLALIGTTILKTHTETEFEIDVYS